TVALASVFGPRWFRLADPIGRTFGIVGRLAMIRPDGPFALRIGLPAEGILEHGSEFRGETGLIIVLIGIILFDGMAMTPLWTEFVDGLTAAPIVQSYLLSGEAMGLNQTMVLKTVGLFLTVATFGVVYLLVVGMMRQAAAGGRDTPACTPLFVVTLLPIALAYHLSHHVGSVVSVSQSTRKALSDPFASGWDLFDTAVLTNVGTKNGASDFWSIALGAVLVGHGIAVLLGHRRALQVFGTGRSAARSQMPMTIATLGLTLLSLWILSQPIVA
ncbi:MAG: hypothetical protein AAF334_11325, partial [Pseudomonadota bacterium]